MSDFWIGAIIVVCCFGVFVLMSVLVVESWKRRKYAEYLVLERENADKIEKIKAGAEVLKKFAASIRMHDQDSQLISQMQLAIKGKMVELGAALDAEDYESAAKLRDDINELREELSKLTNNENETETK